MTRMIFFPGEGSFVVMDSPISPRELTQAVNSGEWTLPAPYDFLNPGENGGAYLQATCQDQVVVVTLTQPIVILSDSTQAVKEPLMISARQHQVLVALAEGLTTRQIALRLKISTRMVMYHVARIKAAFGSFSRAQSVGKAASLGLCRPRVRGRKK